MYVCLSACIYACMYVCMYVCMYTCICIYIYTYTCLYLLVLCANRRGAVRGDGLSGTHARDSFPGHSKRMTRGGPRSLDVPLPTQQCVHEGCWATWPDSRMLGIFWGRLTVHSRSGGVVGIGVGRGGGGGVRPAWAGARGSCLNPDRWQYSLRVHVPK